MYKVGDLVKDNAYYGIIVSIISHNLVQVCFLNRRLARFPNNRCEYYYSKAIISKYTESLFSEEEVLKEFYNEDYK